MAVTTDTTDTTGTTGTTDILQLVSDTSPDTIFEFEEVFTTEADVDISLN